MLFLYVFATYAVSVAMIIFIHVIMDSNGQDTGLFDLDGRGFLLLMFISPIVCGVLFCMFFLRAIYHCLTYFTVNSRHKRKVKALKQEQERERESCGKPKPALSMRRLIVSSIADRTGLWGTTKKFTIKPHTKTEFYL